MTRLVRELGRTPVHLGPGGHAEVLPAYTGGTDWYAAYARRTEADGADGRLVALHGLDADWDTWEMHPNGDEVVVCLAGELTLIRESAEGSHIREDLCAGGYVIIPAGVGHTADVAGLATALFITSGHGTQHRPVPDPPLFLRLCERVCQTETIGDKRQADWQTCATRGL
ncbi:cupin [Novosphingobium profundi]|uniref:cupin n=1 Tax=Novosphingobium profundi TaxID=1774954 RepID=UPI001CFEB7B6|nr:cupin [Novosphingobium profundi]